MCIFFLQKIYGPEAERNFYESQLIILDTLEKVLNGVSYDASYSLFQLFHVLLINTSFQAIYVRFAK